ncbi:hypothetical protein [Arthrobacter sp. SX1312]|uniref:hypothetical protein n=1 Tax=Arthrobacter sp. SX1312 TaxID=2058896 RepID=UPI000CE4D412|nr:hypothetical protein [Arthrobacter sp. SX1312]
MPRFTGKQYPGALKDLREQKRREAEDRNAKPTAQFDVAAEMNARPDRKQGPSVFQPIALTPGAATRLLNAIFGNPTDREVQP